MYRIDRKKRITEELQLGEDTIISIDIDVDAVAEEFNKRYNNLYIVQKNYDKENYEKVINAVLDLFEIVFGEKNTKIIVDFFENKYIEMINQTIPFIKDVIFVEMQKAIKEQREEMKKHFKYKQGRKFNV